MVIFILSVHVGGVVHDSENVLANFESFMTDYVHYGMYKLLVVHLGLKTFRLLFVIKQIFSGGTHEIFRVDLAMRCVLISNY